MRLPVAWQGRAGGLQSGGGSTLESPWPWDSRVKRPARALESRGWVRWPQFGSVWVNETPTGRICWNRVRSMEKAFTLDCSAAARMNKRTETAKRHNCGQWNRCLIAKAWEKGKRENSRRVSNMLVSIFRFQLKPNSPLYSECSGLLGCKQYLSKWRVRAADVHRMGGEGRRQWLYTSVLIFLNCSVTKYVWHSRKISSI